MVAPVIGSPVFESRILPLMVWDQAEVNVIVKRNERMILERLLGDLNCIKF